MSFLSPIAALGALIAIPIILLYMLRLRRRETMVSSNFLWQQIVRDREANTPWQRLRRNLLMLLQLLILALVVLALMRPAQLVPTVAAGKTVILLDASASMNATDINGETRFAEAQRQAIQLINDLGAADEVSVIRVAEVAEPLLPYTSDMSEVRAAISNAQLGQGGGDWATALTLAAAGAQGAENFNIIIISDGGLTNASQLPENIPQPIFIPVGDSADNIAITALATRALPNQAPQLFAQVQNYSAAEARISLVIRLDGELWQSSSQVISAQSSRSFVFEVTEAFSTIQAELLLNESVTDYLALDNVAYSIAEDNSSRRVLLLSSQSNIFLEEVLRSQGNTQTFRGDVGRSALPETPYDLYVFNNYLPAVLPDADMLIINPPSDSELFSRLGASEETGNIRILDRVHPLASFLELETVNLAQFQLLGNLDWATPIASATGGTILWAGEHNGRQIAILPFDTLESDLPLSIAWPIFMSNMLQWASPANLVDGTAFSVGDVLRINPPLGATSARLTMPDGSTRDLEISSEALAFAETQQSGFYRLDILTGAEVTESQVLAFNLFGTGESNIAPVTTIDVGGGTVEGEEAEQFSYRELWPLLLVLALLILLYEWYLYYKRLRVPSEVPQEIRRSTARQ
jgi:Ca-activated chloride channel family protein